MADTDTTSGNFSSVCAQPFGAATGGFAGAATAGTLVAEAATTVGEDKDDAVEEVVVAAEAAGDEVGAANGVGATDLTTSVGAGSDFVSAVFA